MCGAIKASYVNETRRNFKLEIIKVCLTAIGESKKNLPRFRNFRMPLAAPDARPHIYCLLDRDVPETMKTLRFPPQLADWRDLHTAAAALFEYSLKTVDLWPAEPKQSLANSIRASNVHTRHGHAQTRPVKAAKLPRNAPLGNVWSDARDVRNRSLTLLMKPEANVTNCEVVPRSQMQGELWSHSVAPLSGATAGLGAKEIKTNVVPIHTEKAGSNSKNASDTKITIANKKEQSATARRSNRHPGKATEANSTRHPRDITLLVRTKRCPELHENPDGVWQGYCSRRGHAKNPCPYAHCPEELRDLPNLKRTKLCRYWQARPTCPAGSSCSFAHGEEELRVVVPDCSKEELLGIHKTKAASRLNGPVPSATTTGFNSQDSANLGAPTNKGLLPSPPRGASQDSGRVTTATALTPRKDGMNQGASFIGAESLPVSKVVETFGHGALARAKIGCDISPRAGPDASDAAFYGDVLEVLDQLVKLAKLGGSFWDTSGAKSRSAQLPRLKLAESRNGNLNDFCCSSDTASPSFPSPCTDDLSDDLEAAHEVRALLSPASTIGVASRSLTPSDPRRTSRAMRASTISLEDYNQKHELLTCPVTSTLNERRLPEDELQMGADTARAVDYLSSTANFEQALRPLLNEARGSTREPDASRAIAALLALQSSPMTTDQYAEQCDLPLSSDLLVMLPW